MVFSFLVTCCTPFTQTVHLVVLLTDTFFVFYYMVGMGWNLQKILSFYVYDDGLEGGYGKD